jgi:hypothetical protein
MTLWLTEDELATLTGYKRNAERIAWLQRNGFRPLVRPDGSVVVLRSALLPSEPARTVTAPNFEALRV